jgi:hypothetical protein
MEQTAEGDAADTSGHISQKSASRQVGQMIVQRIHDRKESSEMRV